jgi:two-component system, NarL family, response regulator DesR
MTDVLLVHTVALWRASLACLLSRDQQIRVRTTDGPGLCEELRQRPADILIVDLDCPDSAEVLTLAEKPDAPAGHEVPLVVLARGDRAGDLRRASEAGAQGYVDKFGPVDHLCEVVRKVGSGGRHIDQSLAFGLLRAGDVPLSRRELRVLALAAEGESVSSIAGALHLASGTVRNYLASAIRKTGARNRLDAIRLSREFGWL